VNLPENDVIGTCECGDPIYATHDDGSGLCDRCQWLRLVNESLSLIGDDDEMDDLMPEEAKYLDLGGEG
jgi:hypothetical protein